MSQRQRLLLLTVTVAVIVVAFAVLRLANSSDDGPSTETAAVAPTTAATTPAPSATTAKPAPPAPRPSYVQVRAKGLQPVGGVKRIEVKKGDTVRFEVRSDQSDEGHLHGYDISKPIGPGKRGRFTFEAKIDGIFELELENAGVPIAELVVEP